MSCRSCDKDKCVKDIGRGCCFCAEEEGNDIRVSVCEGGQKLHVYDWLEGMPENRPDDIVEVRFKNTRKGYYRNVNGLPLKKDDIVAVEASPGHDIGIVSLTGDLVWLQMKKTGFNPANAEVKKIYRKAKPYDIEKWQEAIALEHSTMIESRQIAAGLKLDMKIGDVEYQGDRIKAIFYYIAEERVDFRELIKILADRFKIRVEMRQIGARQEAGRIGGIGSCGRELCCASWISNFVSVTTNSARVQEISLNPQKLAGQCGKLKCCLIYELDSYIDARREFPRTNAPLEALDGNYYLVKNDIFNRTMYFSSDPHSSVAMIPLPVERVREIIRMNRQGKKVETLADMSRMQEAADTEPDYRSGVGEESITRFDSSKRGGRSRGRNRNGNKGGGNGAPNGKAGAQQKPSRSNEERKAQGQAPEGETGQRKQNPPKRNRYRKPKPKNDPS